MFACQKNKKTRLITSFYFDSEILFNAIVARAMIPKATNSPNSPFNK